MTDFSMDLEDQYYGFFEKLKGAAALCASAAYCLAEATALSEKVREHRIAVRSEKAKAREAACLKEATAFLEKAKEHEEQRVLCKNSALDLNEKAIDHSRHATVKMFFNPRYNSQPFGNLLVFLQRLPPKKAAETLKHIIAIVTNAEIKKFMQDEEIRVATRGEKSLWVIPFFKLMEFVVKNALFCESIKINHKLNFSTNFLGFRVASLQYQGKMAQMRSIAYERLEMFQNRRHNLLTISAFLCFLFRKFLKLPKGHHYSPEMKKLLHK
jgi:hypothetical protein